MIKAFLKKRYDFLLKKYSSFQDRRKRREIQKSYRGQVIKSDEGNQLIHDFILSNEPFMVGRLGFTEERCVSHYLDNTTEKNFSANTFDRMKTYSGFFPVSQSNLVLFSEAYLDAVTNIDLMAAWYLEGEYNIYQKKCPSARLSEVQCIEPYFFENPWSYALSGKKVLIIHPFVDSIKYQYDNHRHSLFENPKVLPDFQLRFVKAVQSHVDAEVSYESWFDALLHMKSEIKAIDFDIALIGAGAYGLPLASYVKSLGKGAIFMGGALQILFGVKGRRWDNHKIISGLYNEFWKRPFPSEIPNGHKKVENSCYW